MSRPLYNMPPMLLLRWNFKRKTYWLGHLMNKERSNFRSSFYQSKYAMKLSKYRSVVCQIFFNSHNAKTIFVRLVTSKIHMQFENSFSSTYTHSSNSFNEMANKLELLHICVNVQLKFYSCILVPKIAAYTYYNHYNYEILWLFCI